VKDYTLLKGGVFSVWETGAVDTYFVQLWMRLFRSAIAFATQPSLQLERFSTSKRHKIFSRWFHFLRCRHHHWRYRRHHQLHVIASLYLELIKQIRGT